VQTIVPVLFRHARHLTRIMGGNADLPQFSAWHKAPKPARSPVLPLAAPPKKPRPAAAPRAGR
jgi:hypothetical protein